MHCAGPRETEDAEEYSPPRTEATLLFSVHAAEDHQYSPLPIPQAAKRGSWDFVPNLLLSYLSLHSAFHSPSPPRQRTFRCRTWGIRGRLPRL